MFRFLGRLAVQHPGKICSVWIAVAVILTLIAPSWRKHAQDDDIRFLPAGMPSLRAYQLLEQAFPQDVSASKVLFAIERTSGKLNEADHRLVDRLIVRLEQLQRDEPALQVNGVTSKKDALIGKRLTSSDDQCTLIQVALATPYLAAQTRIAVDRCEEVLRDEMAKAGETALKLYVTGPAGVGRDLVKAGAESLDQTTVATVALVVVVLLAIYRSPLLALIPLATIAMSAWVSLSLLSIATLIPGVHLVNISQVFAIVVLFGAGTDYCLFLISRYREELEHGREPEMGIRRSMSAVGEAITASAGTVVCGLAMMGFADFTKIRCAGPVIALALAVGLIASLTITPALLKLTGLRAFWPGRISVRKTGERNRSFWNRVGKLVVRRPGVVWVCTFLALAPLAMFGLAVRPTFSPVGDLKPSSGSMLGLDSIRRHFPAGETGPITVLLASDTDWETESGRRLVQSLSEGFGRLDNVAEVRSLTQPLGTAAQASLMPIFQKMANAAIRQRYVSNLARGPQKHVTRIDVILRSDPFEPVSQKTLAMLDHWLRERLPAQSVGVEPVRAEMHGVTVHTVDLAKVIDRDRTRVNLLVLVGVFAILLIVVRKPWLAAYLLATVLFSYYATLGATSLFASAWTGKPLGQIEWRVPFFLFTILVAVGEDYNILMVTRAMQERRKYGTDKGIRRGIAKTGGTITACGVIMAGTFATLMLAGLGTLVQVGFALAVGVLIDTLLIRPLLVPAFMLMMWREETEETHYPATLPLRRVA